MHTTEKEKIRKGWNEHSGELSQRQRETYIHKNMRSTLTKMNRNKAEGPDRIIIDILSALYDFWIEKITKINKIYDISEIPENRNSYIFIAIPKKPGANV